MVSDFKAPRFQGLVVRDHPNGAEVVTSPRQEAILPGLPGAGPNVQRFSLYPRGRVFTRVNGTAVRGAAHFRDLVNAATDGSDQLELELTTGNGSANE